MEQFRTIISGACMLSLAMGLCTMIQPGRLLEKQMRFLLSLLFVLCMAVPFLRIDYDTLTERLMQADVLPESGTLTTAMEQQLLEKTALCSESAVRTLLSAEGIACTDVSVSVHISETGSISISEVSVVCDDFQRASMLLRQQLGEEVALRVEEVVG
ncbi:MAG: hypothetical protein IJN57_07625 [Oscillospiraceae bacterium]|nr:hypothetical protein [Oscillospiraceae bacterium]